MKHIEKDLQLTDGTVLLRPCWLSDVDAVYEAVRESVVELSTWMGGWWLVDYSVEECRNWLESQTEEWEQEKYSFAIIDLRDNRVLGGCGLSIRDKAFRIADLVYWVRTSRTKRGVATAATLLLARFGFNRLNLNRIEIVVSVDNKASQRHTT